MIWIIAHVRNSRRGLRIFPENLVKIDSGLLSNVNYQLNKMNQIESYFSSQSLLTYFSKRLGKY